MMITILLTTVLTVIPCHEDVQCNVSSSLGWRCEADLTAPLPQGNCHLPGPNTAGNVSCSCSEQTCESYPSVNPLNGTKYLMIGDSISLGMQSDVETALKNHSWSLIHNPGNAASSNLGDHCKESWADAPNITNFDVISFNFGLHDIGYDVERLNISQYVHLLQNITDYMILLRRKHSTKLLWVTTTPVPTVPVYNAEGPCNTTSKCLNPPRYNSDVILYNSAAKKIMDKASIPVLDLYTFVINKCGGAGYKGCPGFQLPNNVHYTATGWNSLAQQMTAALLAL